MSTFGPYELLSSVGRGSATEVYRAKRYGVEGFEKTLAVKRLLPEAARDRRVAEAFVRGARRSLRLGHSSVVGVLELGEDPESEGGGAFVVTEWIVGATLGQIFAVSSKKDVSLPAPVALQVCVEVARALAHAHYRRDAAGRIAGVPHGGLTADNVLITHAGEVKVSDFGIAGLGRGVATDGEAALMARDLQALVGLLREALGSWIGTNEGEELSESLQRIEVDLEKERLDGAPDLHERLLLLSYGLERPDPQDLAVLVQRLPRSATTPPSAAYDEEVSRPSRTPVPPAAGARPQDFHAFVGREDELARIGRRLGIAAKRKLQVVRIAGPAGIGKTRFVIELRERLRRSALNVAFSHASCPEHGAGQPGSALTAMLRTLFGIQPSYSADAESLWPALRALGLSGDLAEAIAGELEATEGQPERAPPPLRLALAKIMASLADDRLHVFVWDGAENMDAESSRLLSGFRDDLEHKRLCVILSHRSEADGDVARMPVDEDVILGSLSEREQELFVRARLGVEHVPGALMELLEQRAAGHPMHVDELLREALHSRAIVIQAGAVADLDLSGALAVPDTLTTLISNRARRQGEDKLSVLRAVAALGELADAEQVAEATDGDAETVSRLLDELGEAGLVAWTGQRAYLPSALISEALTQEMTADQRAELWRRAARVLEKRAASERRRLAAAAWRFEQAGDFGPAARAYQQAALAPRAGAGLERSVPLLLRALALVPLDALGDADLAKTVALLASRVRLRQQKPELLEAVRRVSAHWLEREVADAALKIDALLNMAHVLAKASHHLEARRLLDSARELAERHQVRLAQVRLALADGQLALGELDEALAELALLHDDDTMTPGERHEGLVLEAHAHAGLGCYDAALEKLARARGLQGPEDRQLSCRAEQVAALVHALRGDWESSARAAARSAADARATGRIQEEISHTHYEGEALCFQGKWAHAYAAFRKSLSLATDAGAARWVNRNRMLLAFLEAREGSAAAREWLGACVAEAERARDTQDVAKGRLLVAKLLSKEGKGAAARREVELARHIAGSIGHALLVAECELALTAIKASSS